MARQGEYDFTVIGTYNNPEEEEDQAIDFTLVEEEAEPVVAQAEEEPAIDFTLAEEPMPEPKKVEAGGLGQVIAGPEGTIAKRSWQDEVDRLQQLKAQGETVDPIHNKPIDERINFAKMTARKESLANARRAGATEEDIKKWQDRYSWFERYMEQPGKKAWYKLLMAGEARDLSQNLESLYDFDKVRNYLEEAKALPEESLLGSTRSDRTQLAYRIWNNKIVPEIQNCKECMKIWESQNKGVGLTGLRNAPDFTPDFIASVENYFTGRAQKRLLETVKQKIELNKLPEDPVSRRMVEQLDKGDYGDAFETFLNSPFGLIWNTSVESLGVSAPALIEGAYGGVVAGPLGVAAGVANGSFQVDYALEVMKRFEEAGIDFTAPPEEVLAQMRTPGVYEKVVSGARNHAAAVALFDAIAGGFATKVLAPKSIPSPTGRVVFSTTVTQPQLQGISGAAGEAVGQLVADGEITSVGELALEYLGEFGSAPVEVATLRASINQAKSAAEVEQNAQAVLEKVNAAFGTNFTNVEEAYQEIRLRRSVDGYNEKLPQGQGIIDIYSMPDGQYRITMVDQNGEQSVAVGTAAELNELFPAPTETKEETARVVSLEPILVTAGPTEAENVYSVGTNENGDDILFKGTFVEAENMRAGMEDTLAQQIDIERRRLDSTQEPAQVVMPTEDGQYAVYDPATGELAGVYQDETAASIIGESLTDQANLDQEVDQVAAAEQAIAEENAALDAEEAAPAPEAAPEPAPQAAPILPPEVMQNLSPEAQEAINANNGVEAAYQAVLDEAQSIQDNIDATEGMPPEFIADLQAEVKRKISLATEIKNAATAIPAEPAPEQPAIGAQEAVAVEGPEVPAEPAPAAAAPVPAPAAEEAPKPPVQTARDIDLGVFRDDAGRFRSPSPEEVLTKGPRQAEPTGGEEQIDFTLVEPSIGPTSQPVPKEKITVPSAKSQAIFEVAKADMMAKAADIAARPSPDESVARSKNKAEAALRGEYPPRKPLEVWEVTRPDGSKFYSLRDGNTTFQFLTSQGWTEFPVNITNRIPLSEYKPPSAHKAVTLPGGWNGTNQGLQFKTKLDVIKEANSRKIDRALYDIVELGDGFRAVPKAVSVVQMLPELPGEYTLPVTVFTEKEETPAFDGLDNIDFIKGRDLNRFGKLDDRSRQLVSSAVQHLVSRMPEPWVREIRGFMLAYDNFDSATYYTRTRAISIQASFFDQVEEMGEEAAMQKLETILAHELWHDVDIEGMTDGAVSSVAASSPLFNIKHTEGKDGEIIAEAREARAKDNGLYEYLKYPFAREYSILNGSGDFSTFKAEVFAQLGAMYLTRPEMMKENLPKAYKLFKQIEENTYARPVRERRSALRETLQAPDTFTGLNVAGLSVLSEEDQQRAGQEPTGARVEGERPRRDLRLEVTRQERAKKAVAILTKSEIQNIEADAKKYGVSPEPFITAAREYKKAFPARDGWIQISVAGLLKDPKENNPASGIKWQPVRYNFHLDKETGKPNKANYDARVSDLAQKVVTEIEALEARAKKGDANANIILKHEGWYKNMIHRLREDFGASADLYADLLGAFSPNTDVKQNWQYAVEAMRQFSRGEFDAEMADFEKWVNAGNPPSKFEGKKITRVNGKLFGMNSTNGMIALLDLWRAVRQGTAPKARNFSGNLIGGTTRATIDVWAARFLRRLNGDIRIPPGAEVAVSGNFLAGSEDLKTGKIGGEYGFGADVFQQASDTLKAEGINLEPMDLQAVVWFLEKEMWATNNWTTMAGEGGSFEEEADANPLNRYVFGFSIQQESEPTDRQMADARKKIEKVMAADGNIVAYKVVPTYGRYAGWDERSFDIEITTTSEYTPDEIVGLIASLGKQANQKDVFISRIIKDLEEDNPNARPAAEIYLKSQADLDAIKPILEKMTGRELDGFTFTVDPRTTLSTKKGQTPDQFIGIRFQLVPEFTQRAIEQGWTTAEDNPEIASLGQSAILDFISRKTDALIDAVEELSNMPEVAYAKHYMVDTLVIGKENYDDYITAKSRAANQKAGGPWFGQPLIAGLERSARRLGLEDQRAAVLRGAGAGQAEEVAPSISPSVRLSVGQPIRKQDLDVGRQFVVEYKIREISYNRNFDEVYQIAPEDQKKLAEVAARIEGILGDRAAFLNPGIKRRARAEEKLQDKHYATAGVMTDIVRGGFALWDPADAQTIIDELSKDFIVYDEGLIVKEGSGYFDQKLLIRFDDGTVAEIQLWETHLLQSKEGKKFTDELIPDYMKDPWVRTDATPELIAQAQARGEWFPPEVGGHAIYEQTRILKPQTDKAKIDELDQIQSELYFSALRAAPASWAAFVEGSGVPESLISQAEAGAQLTPSSEKKPSSPTMAPSRPSQFQYESTSESLNGLDIVVPPDVSVVTLSQANKALEDAVGAKIISDLTRSGDLIILQSAEEVREHMRRNGSKFVDQVTPDMQGLHDPSTDTAYIVVDSLLSPEDVVGVYYHEVGVHYGLRKMLGNKDYTLIAGMVKRMGMLGDAAISAAIRDVIIAERLDIDVLKTGYQNRFMKQASPEQIEEIMGYLVEKNPTVSIARRIIAAVKRFLTGLGFPVMNEADIRATIISAARRREGSINVTKGKKPLFSKITTSQNFKPGTMFGLSRSGHIAAMAWQDAAGKWTVAFNRDANGLPLQKGTKYERYDTADKAERAMQIIGLATQINAPQIVQAIESEKFVDGLSTLSMSTWDWFVTKAQDKFRALEKAQRLIERERGSVSEAADAYMREALYHGRAEARQSKFNDDFIEPMIQLMKKYKLSVADVDNFLYARHAPEANARLKKINANKPNNDALSGMSNADAAKIMAGFGKKKMQGLLEVAKIFDAMNESRLQLMVDSGLIESDLAATWRATYQYYAPLIGFEEEIETQTPTRGKGFEARGKEKRRFGRRSRAANILTNSVAMYEAQIVRAERNRVGQALLSLANENPNTDFWSVNQPAFRREIDKKTGLVKLVGESARMRTNVFVVKVDGKDHWVTFNERNETAMQIAKVMKGLGTDQINAVMGFGLKINRFLSAIYTSYNPEFLVSNFARDLQTAFINLNDTDANSMKLSIIKDVRKSYAAIRRVQKGGIGKSKMKQKWNDYYTEFYQAGAQTGWIDNYKTVQERAKALEGQLKAAKRGILNPIRFAKGAAELIQNLNLAVENAIRLSTYIHLRDAGASVDKAANVAKNLTVNFNRKGEAGTAMNAFYLFYNAAIQGTARIFLAAARSKKARGVMYSVVGFAAVLDIVNRMRACDDEAGQNMYDAIPFNIKERNLLIMKDDCSGDYYQFPMPYGYNVLGVLGQQMGGAISNPEFDPLKAVMEIVKTTFSAFNPIGAEGSFSQIVSPTLLDPVIQVQENKNWFGGPLVPERFPGKGGAEIPDSQRYWTSTREISKSVAEWVNEMTGGDAARPGWIDISPATLDMLFDTYTGGAGKFVANVANTLDKMPDWAAGEEIDTANVPFVRKVFRTRQKSASTQMFFEYSQDIAYTEEQLDSAKETKDRERYSNIMQNQRSKIQLIKYRSMIEKRIQNLNKKKTAIENSKLPDEDKTARKQELSDLIFMARMNFIQRYRKIVLGLD